MPHIILEYSDNIKEHVDFDLLFQRLHALIVQNGPFDLVNIKSRAIAHSHFYVADGGAQNGFVHLSLSIFAGRDLTLRKALGEKLLAFLQEEFAQSFATLNFSITCEMREMDKETYFKASSGRLSLNAD
jgi:5-carboxymethyl-2-hydroxymuconate isomerase